MRRLLLLLLVCALAPVSGALAAVAAREPCGLPLPSAAGTPALPHVAAALAGAPASLDVLVVGSATVLGPAGNPTDAFPQAMADALRTRVPGLAVSLVVHGIRGRTAAEMVPLLRQSLAAKQFQLVLWQTGTVEAVRRLPPDGFAATLAQGIQAVHAAGADLVLVDPQYSEMLESKADLPPYRAAILQAVSGPGTALLDRYDLMRDWARAGLLDLDHTAVGARAKVSERLHTCLGDMLARRVLAGAAAAGG
ncbi:MAG: hypothetical protein BGP12_07430 [Rhodospirillales bacterium 70-18]|nr:hypothetical protein [Rhodospirillales bacterium]OJY70938.1 MAG: hypothetical protein BGP12_07430 [Rhodospirillales bacterium 70-18]